MILNRIKHPVDLYILFLNDSRVNNSDTYLKINHNFLLVFYDLVIFQKHYMVEWNTKSIIARSVLLMPFIEIFLFVFKNVN